MDLNKKIKEKFSAVKLRDEEKYMCRKNIKTPFPLVKHYIQY